MQLHDEDNDDAPIGKVLSRREALKVLAGVGIAVSAASVVGFGASRAGAVALARSATGKSAALGGSLSLPLGTATATPLPSCVVRPEQTEGPYFVDEMLNRSDIRLDHFDGTLRPGVLLHLTFLVSQINGGCAPLPGAQVDIWHCDALGNYSDVGSWVGHDFLRGYQITGSDGAASFTTIYPGWYSGRTVHIHFKIRIGNLDFTAQLYFDDALTDVVFLQPPYNTRGPRSTHNADDGIYQQGGAQLLLTCTPDGSGGYNTTFTIGIVIAGGTPIPTASGVATSTRTPTATQTPVAGATNTPGATATTQPTNTLQPTSTQGATNTSVATNTPGASATARPTSTTQATNTPDSTSTPIATSTGLPPATNTAASTNTPSPTSTPGKCGINFADVSTTDYFYEAVDYLSCNGVISGYPDNTFRPYNNATRAQFVKIVVLSQGWSLHNPLVPTFSDVSRGSTFSQYIETAVARGLITGYPDGTFRPNENVTRAQVCKVVALALGWTLSNPQFPSFTDVAPGTTFYQYIETAARKGVVNGYGNGTFGPQNFAVRGQIAKIVYLSLGTGRELRR